ncbi:MAG: O-sialoglycoprotein endopeptidase, partial [Acidaminococcaceae bacterium]
MKAFDVYLGIDTSCYTTSVAVLDRQGNLVDEARRVLKVKPGKRGLAQSEMVFQHTRNLPELIEKTFCRHDMKIIGIGVSKQPRPIENSYMPAFLSGYGMARSLAAILDAELVSISHQENHLEAGIWSAGFPSSAKFLMLHASGGTTDLLLVETKSQNKFLLREIGGSIDLHAGQYIDRVGVALGLKFPAGAELEKIAEQSEEAYSLPVAVKDFQISLSGPATAALRAIDAGVAPAEIAFGVEKSLAESFACCIENAAREHQISDVILVGGV